MRTFLLSLLLLPAGAGTLAAQNDTLAIRQVIDQIFDGMRKTDSTLVRSALGSGCFLKTVVRNKEGVVVLQEEAIDNFVKSVGTPRPGTTLDERLLSYTILIDGDMATAWTPYEFYVNDRFNHCGVDAFTLMRTAEGWRIIGIVDTRRKEGCQ